MDNSPGCFQEEKRDRVGERSWGKEVLGLFSKMEIKSVLWTNRKDPVKRGKLMQEGERSARGTLWTGREGMESRNEARGTGNSKLGPFLGNGRRMVCRWQHLPRLPVHGVGGGAGGQVWGESHIHLKGCKRRSVTRFPSEQEGEEHSQRSLRIEDVLLTAEHEF